MGDFGERISIDGEDVRTCEDLDCIVSTKYPLLKGSVAGGGTTTVSKGNTNIITIPHGLDYIPFAQGYVDVVYEDGDYAEMPVYGRLTATAEYKCWLYCDITNLYLKFFYDNSEASPATKLFTYKYFINVDKGKI